MRALLFGVVGLAACTQGESMYYLASTEGQISGVAMRSAPGLEQDAQVGMNDLTCLLGIGTGNVNQEWNYGDAAQEAVADVGWQDGREVVAITGPDTIWLQTNSSASDAQSTTVNVAGVRDVRLLDEGFVALTQTEAGCSLTWSDGAAVPVDCPQALAAGPGSDVAIVGADTGITIVTPEGDAEVVKDGPLDLVAWDGSADAIYAAHTGDTELYVLEPDGQVRYQIDLGYPIADIDAQEGVGRVVAVVDVEDGSGIFLVDGDEGKVVGSQYSPIGGSKDVSSSFDGRAFAIVEDTGVHFYGVGDTWEATGAALETWNESRPRQPTD